MPGQTDQQVLVMDKVRRVGIKLLEDLGAEEEQVHAHRVRHEFRDLVDGVVPDFKAADALKDLEQDQQDGRSGTEGGNQEAGRQDGGVPVGPAAHAVIEERGYRMNAHGQRNRDNHQGDHNPLVVGSALKGAKQQVHGHEQVNEKIAIQDQGVPGQ